MRFTLEAKVGIFVVIGLLLLGYMTTKVEDLKLGKSDGYEIIAYLNDASGLVKDSYVKYRGVEVGKVKDIRLKENHVEVVLLIDKQYKLPSNVAAIVRSSGFLGEKYLELQTVGKETEGYLTTGSEIKNYKSSADFDELQNKFSEIADDIKAITASLKEVIASDNGKADMKMTLQNIRYSTEYIRQMLEENQKRINQIVKNIEAITASIKNVTEANQENVNQLITNLKEVSETLKNQTPQIAKKINNITTNIDDLVGNSKGDLRETISNIKVVTAKLEKTVDNLNDITDKINKGKGTVGTLINDNETAKDVKDTIKGLKNLVTTYDRFKFYLSFSGEKMWDTGESKGYFKLKIQPRKNKYYLLGLATSDQGKSTTTVTDYNYSGNVPYYIDGGTGSGTSYREVKTSRTKDSLTFIAQYVQRFYDQLDLRIGIMESEFGVGADYFPFKDEKLQLSMDAYDFSDSDTDRKPHLKAKLQYNLTKNLFLNVGYDDFLNDDTKSGFIGGGIMFLDEDLKYLFGKIPTSVPGN
ncbi:ABC transporter, substrate-binding protein [Deferribacter desulfuricans SSM1]|uniref:ABC transporter, substrate-binding protein n=1 Tax=Deferribacter desulfuricans (strain DSM 14783 / JCM 11476 / NBRC 101012 / SSM1) TaxID=639282 RepID=D3PDB7_DEFDS|nr:MlaD family protein [Deferribacter desulfuricans]BAI80590.1 ABC transporter, substrate-binding protein [Deferribacter desulfuricans SSM1]